MHVCLRHVCYKVYSERICFYFVFFALEAQRPLCFCSTQKFAPSTFPYRKVFFAVARLKYFRFNRETFMWIQELWVTSCCQWEKWAGLPEPAASEIARPTCNPIQSYTSSGCLVHYIKSAALFVSVTSQLRVKQLRNLVFCVAFWVFDEGGLH